MDNRYFVGELPKSERAKIYDVIVGLPSQQIKLNDGKKVIVKLKYDDNKKHSCLNSFTEITKQEAQNIISKNSNNIWE